MREPHYPLASYTDEQLEQLLERAIQKARRGAHVLGPHSMHAINVEINRRRLAGHRPAPHSADR